MNDDQQQRIAALEAELAAVRAEFATYSGRLSHDLRGIFRNIDGFACALREQAAGRLTGKEARYVERIEAGARRGDGVVRDLSALSAAAVAPLQPHPVDLAGVVRQSIQDLAPQREGRQVEWEVADVPGPRVVADAGQVRLAVDHLLANALKFTRERAPACIRVEIETTPADCAITVTDNGVGFDPAYGDRLFQAFERLHLPSEFEGNGLGLALVRTVAQRHGGRVRAEALPQAGARFTLILPRGGDAAPALQPARPAASAAAGTGRLRILLVDDEPMVLGTLQMLLERAGHEVVAAAGGAAGLQALGQQAQGTRPFDVVLTDWLMPQVSGEDIVQLAQTRDPRPRVILLTGQRPDAHGRHAAPAGVDQVLEKPVRPADLRRALAGLG